jgi:hypothetical protein
VATRDVESVSERSGAVTFNDLRSKSASDAAELADASARLGHTSTAVTKRHYVRKPAKVKRLR